MALLYYVFIAIILQKDTDFCNYVYKPPIFPLSYIDININDGNNCTFSSILYQRSCVTRAALGSQEGSLSKTYN